MSTVRVCPFRKLMDGSGMYCMCDKETCHSWIAEKEECELQQPDRKEADDVHTQEGEQMNENFSSAESAERGYCPFQYVAIQLAFAIAQAADKTHDTEAAREAARCYPGCALYDRLRERCSFYKTEL